MAELMLHNSYPLVYLITVGLCRIRGRPKANIFDQVLPHSVARWTSFASDGTSTAPSGLTFSAATLFSLNGLFNVTLYALTRPGVFPSRKEAQTDIATMEGDEDVVGGMAPT